MYINPEIESSYYKNNIGETLYNKVLELKPYKIIEFGCLYGYSTVSMAMALKELGRGKIYCYDIWEEYKYKHSTFNQTHSNLLKYNVEEYVELIKKDYHEWVLNPEPFDLMHIDISNNGDIIEKLYNALPKGSTVMFEGGSEERDNVEWMRLYQFKPITSLKSYLPYQILNPKFPSLSIFIK